MTVQAHRIYVPFQLAEGREIGNPIPYKGRAGDCAAELRKDEPYYSILITQVPSEQEAIAQFERLIVGLYWVALETRSGLLIQQELQEVYYPADPVQAAKNIFGVNTDHRADAVMYGDKSAIWPDDKQGIKIIGQPVKMTASYSPSRFFEVLDEGVRLPLGNSILRHPKLRLALDLYCLSHFRASDFARFLVLCTVLEAAAPSPVIAQSGVQLIDQWINQALASSEVADQNDKEELKSLARRLGYLKTQSHRSRIQQYVKDILSADGHPDSEKSARAERDLYDVRGDLTHNGKYDLGNSLSQLDEIVCRTLKAAMRQRA